MPYMGAILTMKGLGGAAEAGVIIGAMGVGGLVYVSLVAMLLRRFNRRHFMAVGGLIMTCGPITLAAAAPWQACAIAFAITGFGFMLLHNSIQTEAVDLAPGARQSAYSLHAFSFFSGQAAGPPIFAGVLAALGSATALIASAMMLALTGVIIALLFARLERPA